MQFIVDFIGSDSTPNVLLANPEYLVLWLAQNVLLAVILIIECLWCVNL